jgi:hypothetical protein
MFVQMIRARVKDPAGIDAAAKRWQQELQPGAKGWLGTTSGTTKDNELITVVRFQDEASARANSERPEQSAWWNDFSKNLEGEATFFDSGEVDTFGKGGSDDAGFVQIITGKGKNKNRLKEIDKEMESAVTQPRSDVIGGTSAWSGDRFVQVIYFTTEKEARENEAKGFDGDAKALMEEMQSLMDDVRFFDLNEPSLHSA